MEFRVIIGVLSDLYVYVYALPQVLSRADNKTLICPDGGTCEALAGISVKANELEQIINTIRLHTESRMS